MSTAPILPILRHPDPRLRRICTPVEKFGSPIRELANSMLETMYAANGIGLAASQVDREQRIIVVNITQKREDAYIFVNPEIISSEGENQIEEGCLSVPGIYAYVKRHESIAIEYCTPEGKKKTFSCSGLLAICIQHEIDHLNGKLFVDYLTPFKRWRAKRIMHKNRNVAIHL